MTMIFSPLKKLGPGDLNLVIRDPQGLIFTPESVTYSIFKMVDGKAMLEYGPRYSPKSDTPGVYWVPLTIPTVWEGDYQLTWYIVPPVLDGAPPADEQMVYEDFHVMKLDLKSHEAPSIGMARNPTLTERTADMVAYVRELLADENPDRNYHFRPPTQGKTVAGYTTRVGFIWDDKTIIRMLDLAVNKICTLNPMMIYHYTLDNCPIEWAKSACVGAAAYCLGREAARWTADEFSYSLNGVSLDINKAQMYQSMGESYKVEFTEWATIIAATKPASVGLRQSRWLLG